MKKHDASAMDPDKAFVITSTREDLIQYMKDACYAKFGPEMETQVRQTLLKGNAAFRAGQPDTSGMSAATPPITKEHWDDLQARALELSRGDPVKLAELRSRIPKYAPKK